nr:hypothetical protein CFP56_07750 [Quercus suber]
MIRDGGGWDRKGQELDKIATNIHKLERPSHQPCNVDLVSMERTPVMRARIAAVGHMPDVTSHRMSMAALLSGHGQHVAWPYLPEPMRLGRSPANAASAMEGSCNTETVAQENARDADIDESPQRLTMRIPENAAMQEWVLV